MGIINRILLFFYTLLIALVAVGVIVICSGVISLTEIWNNFLYASGRLETIAGAVVLFLLSIELMGNCFSSKKDKDFGTEGIIVHAEQGDVKISKGAILELANKLCYNVAGVREVKIKTKFVKKSNAEELLTVLKLKLTIGTEYSAVNISNEIQANIKNQLSMYMGLDNVSLDVVIDSISNANAKKKRVV
ncbi:alkaline shock response membrane anchor protein AmaP [Pectinatus brassicae]|uniref:Putative alkaline shock family protein YloU n=1 Tax=Pectinatus brassicae TaxID=862415 RepID=A0A840UHA7_9FIRM|nr:alkaline shock response membrane anchor protein AmaP [Pectinatus brassicae]MBB5336389.1 putative alkaline shock family protein YloU [Pectinatus brassicae]